MLVSKALPADGIWGSQNVTHSHCGMFSMAWTFYKLARLKFFWFSWLEACKWQWSLRICHATRSFASLSVGSRCFASCSILISGCLNAAKGHGNDGMDPRNWKENSRSPDVWNIGPIDHRGTKYNGTKRRKSNRCKMFLMWANLISQSARSLGENRLVRRRMEKQRGWSRAAAKDLRKQTFQLLGYLYLIKTWTFIAFQVFSNDFNSNSFQKYDL